MTQLIKALTARPDDPSSLSNTHMVERENLTAAFIQALGTCMHTNTHDFKT